MKIKKPEDERYFKDIVLNSILDEISSETHIVKPTQKKPIFKKVFFTLFSLFFLFFILFLASLVKEATNDNPVPTSTIDTNETSKQEVINKDNVKTYNPTLHSAIPSKFIAEKASSAKKASSIKREPLQEETSTQVIEFRATHPHASSKPKSNRELAKETLKNQMLQ